MQTAQMPALTLPIADRVVDELQLAQTAEIADRKHGTKDCLQTSVVSLTGQQLHLQEALIGRLLHFDQIRNRNRGRNPGKVHPQRI